MKLSYDAVLNLTIDIIQKYTTIPVFENSMLYEDCNVDDIMRSKIFCDLELQFNVGFDFVLVFDYKMFNTPSDYAHYIQLLLAGK